MSLGPPHNLRHSSFNSRCVASDPTRAAAIKLTPELTGLVRRGESLRLPELRSCSQ
jgi:hypothetical protein